ncbi:OOcyte Partner of Spe-11 (oops-1) [Caenorhabditis elegans]|uniref:OOcyte Partner of Spe-11 (Oops-1) n=2 Tax=Caenorhabditis elegans TaxID=6239 RepID=V6CKF6_CAEEL|nr:OOcyte Partner of Spe-11 (oops-1) [Caenorhabditis elegans]CDK13516.1 OOcyte Partner of Spe-11 (oops-1) [Caenorhabditis elegans]|eukprot:NP_001293789.1 Uncharacterized protein CELE_C31H1.8 [Caenorhabditis elegans]
MEKNEKNGVFSRVRSRWRSIFSKKANPVKLRDCNRLTFERILSDPNEQIGTIVAQATVEPITLPNGGGIALIQETTLYEEDYGLEDSSNFPIISETAQSLRRRMRRLSSGDLNVIRRMTEEIDFDLKNIIYDGNEITGETDADNGNDRACFKPGPDYPIDQQMLFLKQCIKKIDTRPPNMYYLTNGWSVDNFEALFKYMIRSGEDCSRDTLLRVEFRDCVVSLKSLYDFIEEYATFKGVKMHSDYVYAIVHSRNEKLERRLRGAIDSFMEIESKIRQARISYVSSFTINSPHTPNVSIIVKFCCLKPCNSDAKTKMRQISVQVDHVTGRSRMSLPDVRQHEGLVCECLGDFSLIRHRPTSVPVTKILDEHPPLIVDEEVRLKSSYQFNPVTGEPIPDDEQQQEQTEIEASIEDPLEINDFVEMFPLILVLLEKAGIQELEDGDAPEKSVSKYPKKRSIVDGASSETCEDTQSVGSSESSEPRSPEFTEYSESEDTAADSETSDSESSSEDEKENMKSSIKELELIKDAPEDL